MNTPNVYIETYGCAFNAADSEAMAALLAEAGYGLARSAAGADVVVLNSCTVKDRTYLDFRKRLGTLNERRRSDGRPVVVVAGCVPKANPGEPLLENVVCIGAANLNSIVEAVEAALAGRAERRLDAGIGGKRLALPRRRRNPIVEILPINQGCLGACAFCQTRLARGRLKSFPIADVVRRAREAAAEGVREIWLTSQDTGAYGADIGARLPDLLEELAQIEGDFRYRLGMACPQWVRRDLERFLAIYESPRFYQFIHLPVQSGDDRVLQAMRRNHSVEDFEAVCGVFRERFPQIAIWTDVIAGFPGETEEELKQTLELLRRIRPAAINRSRFSPRPGTPAAQMKQTPSRVVAERSRRLSQVVEEISTQGLSEWLGWEGEARVIEVKRRGTAVARNFAYRPIILQGAFTPGQTVHVRVTGHTAFHLEATAAND